MLIKSNAKDKQKQRQISFSSSDLAVRGIRISTQEADVFSKALPPKGENVTFVTTFSNLAWLGMCLHSPVRRCLVNQKRILKFTKNLLF